MKSSALTLQDETFNHLRSLGCEGAMRFKTLGSSVVLHTTFLLQFPPVTLAVSASIYDEFLPSRVNPGLNQKPLTSSISG